MWFPTWVGLLVAFAFSGRSRFGEGLRTCAVCGWFSGGNSSCPRRADFGFDYLLLQVRLATSWWSCMVEAWQLVQMVDRGGLTGDLAHGCPLATVDGLH